MQERTEKYAKILSSLIQVETVSVANQADKSKFLAFQQLLRKTYPRLFERAEFEDFHGSFALKLKGETDDLPILLMNHQDVVAASGEWTHPPFAGEISQGRVWGRGTLDTKGGLFAMLQAAEEILEEGYLPKRDVYFVSTCTEEVGGEGGEEISNAFYERGLRFKLVLDEGGMIVHEPIAGTQGAFAMIGVGEKGFVDLKFLARSLGGHASTPPRNSPLVRLGKFMAAADKKRVFRAEMSPTVCEMFTRIGKRMKGGMKFILGNAKLFKPLLVKLMPKVSNTGNAMLQTTLAFTMAEGSEGTNVLPQEAWVIGNMRYSHHQGKEDSIKAITKFAKKYGVETFVVEEGCSSTLSSYKSEEFAWVERAVKAVYPEAYTTPYVSTGASDSRFMSKVSDNCLRFTPFVINDKQLESIHGIDENVDVATLAPAVDFYKYILLEKE